jgi:hypothetical protein
VLERRAHEGEHARRRVGDRAPRRLVLEAQGGEGQQRALAHAARRVVPQLATLLVPVHLDEHAHELRVAVLVVRHLLQPLVVGRERREHETQLDPLLDRLGAQELDDRVQQVVVRAVQAQAVAHVVPLVRLEYVGHAGVS